MSSKAAFTFIFMSLIFDTEVLAESSRPVLREGDEIYAPTEGSMRPAVSPTDGSLAPALPAEPVTHGNLPESPEMPRAEYISCSLSAEVDVRDGSQTAMGMGHSPTVRNIAECWGHGFKMLKTESARCHAPNEMVVRMQFKKGPKLMKDEKRAACARENRNIASETPIALSEPIPSHLRAVKSMKRMNRPRRPNWIPATELSEPENAPANNDTLSAPAEGL